MASEFAGLFNGLTAPDVQQLMGQERNNRIRQAMVDNKAVGGDYFSALAQRGSKQSSEGIRGLASMLGQKAGITQEDPRLTKARKRDTDLKEINALISGYASDADGLTKAEMQLGFGELMKRGYPAEAKKFLEMATEMNGGSKTRYKVGTPIPMSIKGEDGKLKRIMVVPRTNLVSGETTMDQQPMPDGRIQGNKFRTVGELGEVAETVQKGKEIPKRGTLKYKETLARKTDELQQELNISEAKAKKWGEKALETRETTLANATVAQQGVGKLRSLLALAKARTQGGDINSAFQSLKRAFNKESTPDAEFRTGAQMLMIKNLKRLFGAKATDDDFKQLALAFSHDAQPSAANVAILESMLQEYEDSIGMGTYFANNPDADSASFFTFLKGRNSTSTSSVPVPWSSL